MSTTFELIQANDHRARVWRILVLYVLCGMHAQRRAACCTSAECQLGAPQHPLVRSCKADTLHRERRRLLRRIQYLLGSGDAVSLWQFDRQRPSVIRHQVIHHLQQSTLQFLQRFASAIEAFFGQSSSHCFSVTDGYASK